MKDEVGSSMSVAGNREDEGVIVFDIDDNGLEEKSFLMFVIYYKINT